MVVWINVFKDKIDNKDVKNIKDIKNRKDIKDRKIRIGRLICWEEQVREVMVWVVMVW